MVKTDVRLKGDGLWATFGLNGVSTSINLDAIPPARFFAAEFRKSGGPAAWNGEGLPPIGCECEVWAENAYKYWAHHVGKRAKILAHTGGTAVYQVADGAEGLEYHALVAGNFRPLRTAEQLAAEEREKAIGEMVNVWRPTMGRFADNDRGLAEMLYDAGYRKPDA